MNYTQQHRIEQIKDTTLIVGVDVSKFKQVARAQDYQRRIIEYMECCKLKDTPLTLPKLGVRMTSYSLF